jgi:hypothetical protein
MIPPKNRPPLPMRFWQGKNQFMIRASDCGRYIGSRNGMDVAISSDPVVLMRILVAGPGEDTARHVRKRPSTLYRRPKN